MIMFYVYAIKSQFNSRTYIGQTQEINKRLQMHNSGHVRSTAKDRPWELLAIERFNTRKEARWIERQLKRSKGRREAWIHSHTIEHTARRGEKTLQKTFYQQANRFRF